MAIFYMKRVIYTSDCSFSLNKHSEEFKTKKLFTFKTVHEILFVYVEILFKYTEILFEHGNKYFGNLSYLT